MAPLELKIKGDETFSPFSTLTSEEDLSKTWRVCTKVKDSLENGSRLENLSWRLWFRQHLLNEKTNNDGSFRKLSMNTARKLNNNCSLMPMNYLPVKNEPTFFEHTMARQQQEQQRQEQNNQQEQLLQQHQLQQLQQGIVLPIDQQPLLDVSFFNSVSTTPASSNNYTLPQYTSDQTTGEIVELGDIFKAFNSGLDIPTNADMGMADGWDFGIPSPTNPYYSPTQPTLSIPSPIIHQPQQQTNTSSTSPLLLGNFDTQPMLGYSQQLSQQPTTLTQNEGDAMYVSGSSMPPPPTATLRSKLLGNMQQNMGYPPASAKNQRFTKTPPMSASSSASTTASIASVQMSSLMEENGMNHHNRYTDFADHLQQRRLSASAPVSPQLHPHQQAPMDTVKASTSRKSATLAATCMSASFDNQTKPVCTNCGATSTPLWRRSSEDELLCNACGLYQKLHNAPRPKTLKPHNARKEARDDEASQLVCSNCSTTTTPLWRRDDEGAPLCNACGLYLKLHHERRPLSMKTDIIKKRQRYESNPSTANTGGRKNSGKKSKGDITPSSPGSQQEDIVAPPTTAALQQQLSPLYVSSAFNQPFTQQPGYQTNFDTTPSTTTTTASTTSSTGKNPSIPIMDEMMSNNYF